MSEPTGAGQQSAQDPSATASEATGGASLWSDAWLELRKSPLFVVSALLIVVVLLMTFFPGLFTDTDPRDCSLARSLQTPSSEHWFGTDLQGCDYYARTIYGARASIVVGITSVSIAAVIAVTIGSLAGYYRRWVDALISRTADVFFAIPVILAGLVLLSVLPRRGTMEISLVLGTFGWPAMMRLMRSSVLSVAEADYVQAARALGANDGRIMRRHILPNAITPVIVYGTIFVGIIIAAEATLTFLGVGLQLPSVSWGLMISLAQRRLLQAPHLLLFPGLFLSVTIFAFILMGDALRDAFDPKLR